MFLTTKPFEQVGPKELEKYEKLLIGLRARLIIDNLIEDQRGARRVLNAKYLAAKDVERAAESLTTYRELLEDPPSGAAAASDR